MWTGRENIGELESECSDLEHRVDSARSSLDSARSSRSAADSWSEDEGPPDSGYLRSLDADVSAARRELEGALADMRHFRGRVSGLLSREQSNLRTFQSRDLYVPAEHAVTQTESNIEHNLQRLSSLIDQADTCSASAHRFLFSWGGRRGIGSSRLGKRGKSSGAFGGIMGAVLGAVLGGGIGAIIGGLFGMFAGRSVADDILPEREDPPREPAFHDTASFYRNHNRQQFSGLGDIGSRSRFRASSHADRDFEDTGFRIDPANTRTRRESATFSPTSFTSGCGGFSVSGIERDNVPFAKNRYTSMTDGASSFGSFGDRSSGSGKTGFDSFSRSRNEFMSFQDFSPSPPPPSVHNLFPSTAHLFPTTTSAGPGVWVSNTDGGLLDGVWSPQDLAQRARSEMPYSGLADQFDGFHSSPGSLIPPSAFAPSNPFAINPPPLFAPPLFPPPSPVLPGIGCSSPFGLSGPASFGAPPLRF